MSEKQCPYCAETIQAEAIKCKHCGSDLNAPPEKKKNPGLGFSGVLLITFSIILFCVFSDSKWIWFPAILLISGILILIFAIASGNTKFMG